jgi:hypothetical protein
VIALLPYSNLYETSLPFRSFDINSQQSLPQQLFVEPTLRLSLTLTVNQRPHLTDRRCRFAGPAGSNISKIYVLEEGKVSSQRMKFDRYQPHQPLLCEQYMIVTTPTMFPSPSAWMLAMLAQLLVKSAQAIS